MHGFRKRTYRNPAQVADEFAFLLRHHRQMRLLLRGRLVSPAFRERLVLAVTGVNDCRYCSYFHTWVAAQKGITREEAACLLGGVFAHCPEEELPALVYAQHWAECDARPDPLAQRHLVATYGQERAEIIELVLRTIRIGNLLGNTGDYVLYRLSAGRLGR